MRTFEAWRQKPALVREGLTFRRTTRFLPAVLSLLIVIVLLTSALAGISYAKIDPAGRTPGTSHSAAAESSPSVGGLPSSSRPLPEGPSKGIGVVLSRLQLSSNQSYPGGGTLPAQIPLEQELATYDPVNGNVYVRGGDTDDVSVVNATTFTDIANIPVPVDNQRGFNVDPFAVDNQTGYLYVTNAGVSSNLSIISGTSEKVTGAIPVGGDPAGIAFDWRNHDFYVADYSTGNVTVVSATTNRSVASVPVGTDPLSVVYDPASDRVFVTNYGSANVSVISPSTNKVVASVKVKPDPMVFAIDTTDDLIDVLNNTGGFAELCAVSVFSATAASPVATNVSVASYAESFAYDPVTDQLFVAGGDEFLTVIQQPEEMVVPTTVMIGDGATGGATAFDPKNGDIIVSGYNGGPSGSGNITVISGASDKAVSNVSTDDGPYAVVVDPGTGDAYAVNGGTSILATNVTVLSGETSQSIASVPLWVAATGITYDSAQQSLYTVDTAGNSVYEVNAAADHVAGVDIGGPYPTSYSATTPIVYDGANGEVYTADGAVAVVDVFGPSHSLLKAIPVGNYPVALAYDNVSDLLFVVQGYQGNVSIIDTTTNTVLPANLLAGTFGGGLDAIAYDPSSNEVYIGNTHNNTVSVWGAVDDTLVRTIHVGDDPESIVVDPQNHTVFVANAGSSNVSVIADTTNSVVETVPLTAPYLLAYDSGAGTIYNAEADNVLEAFNATTYLTLSGSPLYLETGAGYPDQGIAYAPSTGDVYVTDPTDDSIITVGPVPTYPIEFFETGLRQGTLWSVTLNGTKETALSPVIEFTETAGTDAFTIGPVPGYTSTPTYGTVVVPDAHQPIDITFTSEFTAWSAVTTLLTVYSDRPDLQAAYPDAFSNFTNYSELVHWAAWVVAAGPTSDANYSTLDLFGYWYALMGTYADRADLQLAYPDAFGNFTNYTELVHWAAWVVADGSSSDSAYPTLSSYGYWYELMGTYTDRADLQLAYPDAYGNFTNYTELVHWAAWVVAVGSTADSAWSVLSPFGWWYALMGTYTDRSDLQGAFPNAYTNFTSYDQLVSWAAWVCEAGPSSDSSYPILNPYAAIYEELA